MADDLDRGVSISLKSLAAPLPYMGLQGKNVHAVNESNSAQNGNADVQM